MTALSITIVLACATAPERDPDRHARSGRGSIRFPAHDVLFLRSALRHALPSPGTSASTIPEPVVGPWPDQDLALGAVDGADRKCCAIFLGGEANGDGRPGGHRGGRQDGGKRGKG